MDGKQAERVIQAFGAVQLETAGFLVAQESRLPFPKDEIKKAILFAMPLVDSKTCEFLRSGYVQLGMFHDVREIPMLDIPDEVAKLSDEELYKFIQHAGADRLEQRLVGVGGHAGGRRGTPGKRCSSGQLSELVAVLLWLWLPNHSSHRPQTLWEVHAIM